MVARVWLSMQSLPDWSDAEIAPTWLSPSEHHRFSQITATKRRAQFVAARLMARQLLASVYGGFPLIDWQLTATADAPPRIEMSPEGVPSKIVVSISHSGQYVACAMAEFEVGIDIEILKRPRDLLKLAAITCNQNEQARLINLPESKRHQHFQMIWTLKEAWIKQHTHRQNLSRLPLICTEHDDLHPNAWVWQQGVVTLALAALTHAEIIWQGEAFGDNLGIIPWRIMEHKP